MRDLNYIYTRNDIIAQLSKMKAPKNSVVLMHSSLRLIGKVEGGAEALLDILIEYFTAEGGLFCVPTHTWRNIGKEIVLDMSDPNTSLGVFSNIAVADPRGVRSQNPTHSMVVFGDRKQAENFVNDDRFILSGTAPESCYGKLYRMGGYVLLVGVSHNRNTYLHCVGEMLGIPNRMADEPRTLNVRLETGEVIPRQMRGYRSTAAADISTRFPKYETAFRYHGAITDGFIGNAPTQLCDARIMKETVERIFKNSNGTDSLADERALSPKLYF